MSVGTMLFLVCFLFSSAFAADSQSTWEDTTVHWVDPFDPNAKPFDLYANVGEEDWTPHVANNVADASDDVSDIDKVEGVSDLSDNSVVLPETTSKAYTSFEDAVKSVAMTNEKLREVLGFFSAHVERERLKEEAFGPDNSHKEPDSKIHGFWDRTGDRPEEVEDLVASPTPELHTELPHCIRGPLAQPDCIPGAPGLEYPVYDFIPNTSFSCWGRNENLGMYADVETRCQVFHVCLRKTQETCLCPIGSIFNQVTWLCDYWFKSNCSLAPAMYPPATGHWDDDDGTTDNPEFLAALERLIRGETTTASGTTDPTISTTEDILNRKPKFPLAMCQSMVNLTDPEAKNDSVVQRRDGRGMAEAEQDQKTETMDIADDIIGVAEHLVRRARQLVSSLQDDSVVPENRSDDPVSQPEVSSFVKTKPAVLSKPKIVVKHSVRQSPLATKLSVKWPLKLKLRRRDVPVETEASNSVEEGSRVLRALTEIVRTLAAALEEDILPLAKRLSKNAQVYELKKQKD